MTTLQFNPAVYRVKTESATGTTSWDLLTVDGSNPRETIYFMLKNDLPSHNDSDAICAAIDNEEWEELDLDESGTVIDDYCIDISVFESAGEAYEVIKDSLLYICPFIEFSKEEIIAALHQFSESYIGENLYIFTRDELIVKLEEVAAEHDCEFTAIDLLKGNKYGF